MTDLIVSLILVTIIGSAAAYVIHAKKHGVKCIGCPAGAACGSCGQGASTDCSCNCCGQDVCCSHMCEK